MGDGRRKEFNSRITRGGKNRISPPIDHLSPFGSRFASYASISALSRSSGINCSTVSDWRLKGSVGSLKRCRMMTERSTVILEVGKMTGSRITVCKIGSKNRSGASAMSSWYLDSSSTCLAACFINLENSWMSCTKSFRGLKIGKCQRRKLCQKKK